MALLYLVAGGLVLLWWRSVQSFGRDFDQIGVDDPVKFSTGLVALADAITTAEGSDPKYHNPGDIKIAGWTGPTFGAEHIPILRTPDEGLHLLYGQLTKIQTGESTHYRRSMTIAQMGQVWAGNANWGINVARALGVPVETTLDQVFG